MKSLGIISILGIWLAAAYLLLKWPRERGKSISQHSAKVKEAYIFFTVSQTIAGILFYIFMTSWFIPEFHLSSTYYSTLLVAFIFQVVSAWVPDSKGLASIIHKILAYTMAIMIILMTLQLSTSDTIFGFAKMFATVAAIYMVVSLSFVALSKRIRAHYLILQAIFIVFFHLSVLVTTYIR